MVGNSGGGKGGSEEGMMDERRGKVSVDSCARWSQLGRLLVCDESSFSLRCWLR